MHCAYCECSYRSPVRSICRHKFRCWKYAFRTVSYTHPYTPYTQFSRNKVLFMVYWHTTLGYFCCSSEAIHILVQKTCLILICKFMWNWNVGIAIIWHLRIAGVFGLQTCLIRRWLFISSRKRNLLLWPTRKKSKTNETNVLWHFYIFSSLTMMILTQH